VLIPQFGVDSHVLLTRPPLVYSTLIIRSSSSALPPPRFQLVNCDNYLSRSNTKCRALPLDLHVLGTPPAFILSQDQTLHKKVFNSNFNEILTSQIIFKHQKNLTLTLHYSIFKNSSLWLIVLSRIKRSNRLRSIV
jgi:hypothetical protein